MSVTTRAESGLVARDSRQWLLVATDGAVGVLIGVVALFLPGLALVSAALLLGIGLVVQGVLEIAAALRGGTGPRGRAWLVAFGVLAVVAGVLVLAQPAGGIVVLVWGLVIWFVVAGVHDIIAAFSGSKHRVWDLFVGVLGLLVAVILAVSPAAAVGFLATLIALGFLFRGVADIGLAAAMRRAARTGRA